MLAIPLTSALLAAAALAAPLTSSTDALALEARAGGYGYVDPNDYFCNQTWVTPAATAAGVSFSGNSSFHPAAGIIEKHNVGGFSMDAAGANLTAIRKTCREQCSYAQYPASPQLNGAKCRTAFVATNAPSTYTNYANNSSPATQAPTHAVCHWLSVALTAKDLVRGDGKTFSNASAEVISCPGVVYVS